MDDTSIMSGCAPLVIPPEWHLPILDFRERLARGKGRMLTRDVLREMDVELRELYFHIEDQVSNQKLPELRNTGGDRLLLTVLTYRLRCSPSAAFEGLKSLARAAAADVSDVLSDATLDESGELKAITIPWSKKGNRLHQEWDHTTLGKLDIDGDRLQVHVNSDRRARRIEREIGKRLGADAVLESRTADPVEKLLAERYPSMPCIDRKRGVRHLRVSDYRNPSFVRNAEMSGDIAFGPRSTFQANSANSASDRSRPWLGVRDDFRNWLLAAA